MTFQDNLYNNYYSIQASRYSNSDLLFNAKQAAEHYKKEIVPLLPQNKNVSIFEVGCGHGSLLSTLKDLGYKNLFGMDKSKEQVSLSKKLNVDCIKEGDFLAYLKNEDNKYDVIIGIDVIEHLNKDELLIFLESAYKSLNKKGTIVLRTPNGDAPFGSTYYFGDFTHQLVLNAFSAEQVMIASGFTSIHILPSRIFVSGYFKELLRKLVWFFVVAFAKATLFASGKSIKTTLLSPNIILKGTK